MSDDYTREIAKITRTHLGPEEHGILTGMLHVTYGGGASQFLGGYDLRRSTAGPFIAATLKACGVDRWEDLVGRTIYVLTKDRRVEGIEPLPTERGERFIFADLFGAPGEES